ncbi:MAG: tRNA (adenosine(37)-N6)-dimethylallyltransferase MiaA [Oscillospiraceae bacterium]
MKLIKSLKECKDTQKIPLIAVVGPTASGKTKVAVELAKQCNGEVVSCDSMQIYKDMDIATAKPTIEEMQGIKHHLIGFLDSNEVFSVAEYVRLAHSVIKDIYSRGKMPILVGGTGLYFSSLVNNLTFNEAQGDEKLRQSLLEYAKKNGNQALHKELEKVDEQAASLIHPNNVIRVIRAIESQKLTGKTRKENGELSREKPSNYLLCAVGLNYVNRKDLYERIDMRVDLMLKNGLLKEAQEVYKKGVCGTGTQAIGYKELFLYFEGKCLLDEAIEQLKRQSRRYAKRQLTWFLRDSSIKWVNITKDMNFEDIMEQVNKNIDFSTNVC